jgi:hypothetical protein
MVTNALNLFLNNQTVDEGWDLNPYSILAYSSIIPINIKKRE